MATKTFKADSMLQALQLIQEEMGDSAIVISTRDVPAGPAWNRWKKIAVEIVAASPDSVSELKGAPSRDISVAPGLKPAASQLIIEKEEEIPDIEWVTAPEPVAKPAVRVLAPKASPAPIAPAPEIPEPLPPEVLRKPAAPQTIGTDQQISPALKKIQQQLSNQGIDSTLISGLVNVALETLSASTLADEETSKKYLLQLLGAELRVQPGLGSYREGQVICLIGSSGSGKTATLAKLALFLGEKLKKKILWVCADTVRVGAITEARAFTDALGIPLKLAYSPADLKAILSNPAPETIILVDTPGYNPCSESQVVELGALLAEAPRRCTYLVAPATTKEADLFQLSAAFGIFNLDGLIVTKLDETNSFGSVYNFARKSQVPLGYFTTGKEVARNLEQVDPARLVAALFGKGWAK